ncbi:hypothetical protein ABH957_005669 [Bacillus sp. RC242]|uniref:ETX/MTX2 family pore-forming toxin n=1 Tax=Bacillus sp. RC242 TaxID=3156286 RepID=UPI0021EFD101
MKSEGAQVGNLKVSVELTEVLKNVGFFPVYNLIRCDMDTFNKAGNKWSDNGYYPFPISNKISSNCAADTGDKDDQIAYDCNLEGIDVMDVQLSVDAGKLFANTEPFYYTIQDLENKTSVEQTMTTLQYSEQVTDTTTVTKTKTIKAGTEVSVKTDLDVFDIVGVEVVAKVTVQTDWSTTTTDTHTVQKTLTVPPLQVKVPSGKGVHVKAQVLRGTLTSQDITANAKFYGAYNIQSTVDHGGPGAWHKGDIYPFLKTVSLGSPKMWEYVTDNEIVLNDDSQTVSVSGIGLLDAEFTTTNYTVVEEEYDLVTKKVEKVRTVQSGRMEITQSKSE